MLFGCPLLNTAGPDEIGIDATSQQTFDRHNRAIALVLRFRGRDRRDETFERLRAFMVSYLGLMEGALPDVAKRGLAV
jgi:hypothetical protein